MNFRPIPEVEIDLTLHGAARWEPLRPYRAVVQEMIRFALADAADGADLSSLAASMGARVGAGATEDLAGLATVMEMPADKLLAGNLYYDSLKSLWACSAFAVDTPDGPLHARNLDWIADDLRMSEASITLKFVGGRQPFLSVGWPGMIGVLSAMAPGRFSVSLNAVSSDEPPHPGTPIVFLLRRVMEEAEDFTQAVALLTDEPICSDCILLIAGTQPGEIAVVERTPTRTATLGPSDGHLVATNHYRALDIDNRQLIKPGDQRSETTRSRRGQLSARIGEQTPTGFEDCLTLLRDPAVFMEMTVQQMAFQPAKGTYTACLIQGR